MGNVCGIDQRRINNPGSDRIEKADCAKADQFNKTLDNLRDQGKDAAWEASRQAGKQTGTDNTCAAAHNEVAAVETLKVKPRPSSDQCGDAQRHYDYAAADRAYASAYAATAGDEKMAAAKKAKTHGEAAKNYGEAAKHYGEAVRNGKKSYEDLKRAEEIAIATGKSDDAKEYHQKADKVKAAGIEDGKSAREATAAKEKAEDHIRPKKHR